MAKVCLNHPDREATDKCIACFKPLCSECVVDFHGDSYCSESCRDGALKTTANIAEFQEKEKAAAKKRAIKKLIIFVILAGLIGAAVYYVMHDKKLRNQLEEQAKKVKAGVEEQTK